MVNLYFELLSSFKETVTTHNSKIHCKSIDLSLEGISAYRSIIALDLSNNGETKFK